MKNVPKNLKKTVMRILSSEFKNLQTCKDTHTSKSWVDIGMKVNKNTQGLKGIHFLWDVYKQDLIHLKG